MLSSVGQLGVVLDVENFAGFFGTRSNKGSLRWSIGSVGEID